ncbi:MAG: hypothetical protein AzoDbin1_04251 [Azoarcus sp.]|nr:hypothetical protein [Azoarcus sp.]
MKVFWSWQSDTPAVCNRDFVKEALHLALEKVSDDLGLDEAYRAELDHDTKDAPGMVAIVDEIFRKIADAKVFIGDITFVGSTQPKKAGDKVKLIPNPNVLIELGHALTSVGPAGIILVTNTAFGGQIEDLPFDLRHRRGPIRYELKPDASPEKRQRVLGKLVESLVECLTVNLGAALAKQDAEKVLELHPSREGDRSTWLQVDEPITHHDSFLGASNRAWTVPEQPRAYMRFAPSGWKDGKPSRHNVIQAPDPARLRTMYHPLRGDYGGNERGAVAIGVLRDTDKSIVDATQWFHKTGELWGFTISATYLDGESGRRTVAAQKLAETWRAFMDKGLHFFEHFGAQGPIRIEAGVVGLQGTHFHNQLWGLAAALENEVYLERSLRDWTAELRRDFVFDLNNLLLDAFGQPPVKATGRPS